MDHLSYSTSDYKIDEEHANNSKVKHYRQGKRNQDKHCLLKEDDLGLLEDEMLCARASARVQKTHILLKAPFLFLTISTGLWPKRWRGLQYFLLTVGVIINLYIFIGNVAVFKICGAIPDTSAEKLSPWLCYGSKKYNQTSGMLASLFRPVFLARIAFSFAQISGYLLMIYSVLVFLDRQRESIITLRIAMTLMTRNHWIRLNVQIVLSCVIYLAFLICDIKEVERDYPFDHAVIWIRVETFTFWLYIGAPCWIFAVETYALESLIDACYDEIEQLENGTLDDVVTIYRQLCKYVFNTVGALRFWFVIHWMTFGVALVVDVAIRLKAVEGHFSQKESQVVFWIFSLTFIGVVLHPFLYSSTRAASLTSTCSDMLERLNFGELPDKHPLGNRRDMNDFLTFAIQIRCGFRIGRLTFDNGLAWLSAFFGIFGLVLKLM